MGEVLIGTSGFSYKDWKGTLYPENLPAQGMLAYYSTKFPLVELDFSYYQMPGLKTIDSMEKKTPPEFVFAVKAHKSMTHEFSNDINANRFNFQSFITAMRPLEVTGKLGCILAQFPWSFKPTPETRSYLNFVREELKELPAVIEFRNVEWVQEDTFKLLKQLDFGFCCVDEPKLKGLFPPLVAATSKLGYLRFHGRNAAKWWKHREPWERYDYLYSKDELLEWQPKILKLKSYTEKTLILFNNCHAGHAAVNAFMLQEMLEEES